MTESALYATRVLFLRSVRTDSPSVAVVWRKMRGLFVVTQEIAVSSPPPPHTQHVVGPEFHISQYRTTEGDKLVVRLSARILTRPQVPPFNGSIDVDITAEEYSIRNAQFSKCHPSVVQLRVPS